jgi:TIR domain
MPGIFISYRRKDTGGHAGRLKADLGKRYGRSNVFMDIDSIPAGRPYADPIHEALTSSQVALVLIGEDWLALAGHKERRIDEEADWVRREVAAALGRDDVTVIPILVERATMPEASDLPSDIAHLSEIEACELRSRQWKYDLANLYGAVDRVAPHSSIRRALLWLRSGPKLVAVAVAIATAAALVAAFGIFGGSPESSCANQVITPDVRDRLSVAQGTSRPALEGSVYYGTCGGQSWALAEFPHDNDGVFKQTGFTWTRLGSIESAKCKLPSDLLAAWNQGGC